MLLLLKTWKDSLNKKSVYSLLTDIETRSTVRKYWTIGPSNLKAKCFRKNNIEKVQAQCVHIPNTYI